MARPSAATWVVPSSARVKVANVKLPPDGPVTAPPEATRSGGQNVRHCPVQTLPLFRSDDSVYSVMPFGPVRTTPSVDVGIVPTWMLPGAAAAGAALAAAPDPPPPYPYGPAATAGTALIAAATSTRMVAIAPGLARRGSGMLSIIVPVSLSAGVDVAPVDGGTPSRRSRFRPGDRAASTVCRARAYSPGSPLDRK